VNSIPLTPTRKRAAAAAVVRRAGVLPPESCMLAAEIVDGCSAAILRAAGCTDSQALEALAALWADR
jgi:hypothetical protein